MGKVTCRYIQPVVSYISYIVSKIVSDVVFVYRNKIMCRGKAEDGLLERHCGLFASQIRRNSSCSRSLFEWNIDVADSSPPANGLVTSGVVNG